VSCYQIRDAIVGEYKHTKTIRNTHRIVVYKHEGKEHLVDLGLDGTIILKWILNIITDLIKALPGNGSVNTSQHATVEGKLCFLCGLPQATIGTGFSVANC
jgi:hypothetical protein